MPFKKLTPLLAVEAIEPCLPFWTERLGFAKAVEVPHGDRLGFAILARDGVEVMLQTHASLRDDLGLDVPGGGGVIYVEVADLDPILTALQGADIAVPERTTFYGAREVFVREPGGHLIGFAQHG